MKKRRPRLSAGKIVLWVSTAAGVIGCVAAVLVVPEARCWLLLDKCPADSRESQHTTQTGIANSGKIQVGGSISVDQRGAKDAVMSSAQTGIINPGTIVVHGNLTVGNNIGSPVHEDCAEPYLQVRLDDRIGTLVEAPQGGANPRRFRFFVGNPTHDCTAQVRNLFVEVVDVVDDHHPSTEALTSTYKYKVAISKADRGKRISISLAAHDYTPLSRPDAFVIDVFSRDIGVAYALRFGVEWFDLRTNASRFGMSWVAIAPFPDNGLSESVPIAPSEWRRQQLVKWRTKFDKTQDAVADASTEDPGYERESVGIGAEQMKQKLKEMGATTN